ncbi:MAG: prephenate dehydrogenase/arogenate dehydrogenase family protein [Dehalococcoidia bacterium]|nr:prephenate dehydrogenase/arogenate dehydrogenase family protein [Dehalococcoidia bacterium]
MKKIAIVGLGLIGASIGLGLRAAGLDDARLVGFSRSQATRVKARQAGVVDETAGSLASGVEGASLVILATPVMAIEGILREIGPVLAEGCIVTDVASTKSSVMRWAAGSLPESVSFVGGHPMAGREAPGIDAADAGLFRGCTYCICAAPGTAPRAVDTVAGLATLLGAIPYFLDPAEHDSLVAGISHLPMLLSTALVSATTSSPAWRELSRLASSGYRDTTRLASSDPVMSRDIYLTNQESLGRWLDILIGELENLRRDINDGAEVLEAKLRRIKDERDRWQQGEAGSAPAPSAGPSSVGVGHLFFGNLPSQLSRTARKSR